jgi:hypothetical protein
MPLGAQAQELVGEPDCRVEEITLNLGSVDLVRMDLLVAEELPQSTHFIRSAIRNQLEAGSDEISQTVNRRTLVLGRQRALQPQQVGGVAGCRRRGPHPGRRVGDHRQEWPALAAVDLTYQASHIDDGTGRGRHCRQLR